MQTVVEEVKKAKTGISKANLVAAIEKETGVKAAYAYRIVSRAEKQRLIRRRTKDDLYVENSTKTST